MELFILRHGDAAREAPTDQERPLTPRGREELRSMLADRRDHLAGVSHMLVSPYVRTLETAKIAADYLPASVVVQTTELLVPEADPTKLTDCLQQLKQEVQLKSVLLVSHQPLVGVFLDRLCGFEVGRYRMGTGALAHVTAAVVASGMGHLNWLRQPSDLA